MNSEPLVSICCLTYNHAPFIKECLDGFLRQKTDFPIEILIHDDASTDGTDGIIRDYTERYPELFFPIYEVENQYSKGFSLAPSVMDITHNYSRARGKYIAYCEGDDYWTDPYKLQKQVDFLETHQNYSVCWHRCKRFLCDEDRWEDDKCEQLFSEISEGIDIDAATMFSGWYTQPLTMMFRRSAYNFEWGNQYKYYRDEHEMYHLLTVGKGYLLNFIGGVYVIHETGVFGSRSILRQSVLSCQIAEELSYHNRDKDTKLFYANCLQWAIVQHKNDLLKKIMYSCKLFFLNGKASHLIKNLLR